MMTVMLSLIALLGSGGPAVLETRALIEQALDEPANISLEDIPLADAIQTISRQTGVPIVMPAEVMDLVPHGGNTRIQKVRITDMPLRRGLTDLFSPLGMTFAVNGDQLTIVPKDALLCLGRAPTWEELGTLDWLARLQPGVDETALSQLQARMQWQSVPNALSELAAAIRAVGAGPGDEVLTIAAENIGWAWCLSGPHIVLGGREHQIRQRLRRPLSLRINHRSFIDVLQALGQTVNLPVRAEPGAVASLPPHMQKNYSLNASNAPMESILEKIAADTGLGYLISPEGISFYQPGAPATEATLTASPAAEPAPPAGSDPFVGKVVISLDGGKSIEWVIRRSELPPDLRDRREQDLRAAFEALRREGNAGR